ncbi:MAG: hypothetical protein IRZ21_06250 [Thermoleophilaceae bacterium]|nr:hypothetical protein [Thermoleophilaceae bacterium]
MLVESIVLATLLLATAAAVPLARRRVRLCVDHVLLLIPAPPLLLIAVALAACEHLPAAIAVAYAGLQAAVIACWFPTGNARWSRFERDFWAYVREAERVGD